MLEYDRIEMSEEIQVNKNIGSQEYWVHNYFTII